MIRLFSIAIIGAFILSSCSNSTVDTSAKPLTGDDIQIKWKSNGNHFKGEFNYSNTIIIKNVSDASTLDSNWSIYFNQLPKSLIESPTNVSLEHINGDLYKISPNELTGLLSAGDSIVIDYVCNDWVIKNIDAPCGFYLINKDQKPSAIDAIVIAPIVSDNQTKRFDGDNMAVTTNESRFSEFSQLNEIDQSLLPPIVPRPNSYEWKEGKFKLNGNTSVSFDEELLNEVNYLKNVIDKELGIKLAENEEGSIALKLNADLKEEAYTLNVSGASITIEGGSSKGVFYGVQSLIALVPVDAFKNKVEEVVIKAIEVSDSPRFAYRGMHLDVGRNFQSKESVLKLLDYMAFYKLNKFHFHLTDDEGWRIEIPTLPELTEIGAFRGHTETEKDYLRPAYGSGPDPQNSYGSGFYSKEDYIEILKYASERHINVIPEFDLPGHARAAIKAMDVRYDRLMAEGKKEEADKYLLRDIDDKSIYSSVQKYNDNVLCVCKPSVYTFIETVIDDLVSIYSEANHELNVIHIGADEVPNGVWTDSPICDSFKLENGIDSKADLTYHFLKQYYEILQKHNLTMGGWEEIGMIEGESAGSHVVNEEMSDKNLQPYVWNNVWGWGMEDFAYKLANTGYNVVLSNATNLYFDLAYNKDPNENGYYWAGFCNARKTFEFTPMDIFKSAYEDRMGNELNDSLWDGKTKLTQEGRSNVLGIQGQLWSETVRTPQDLEYYLFPKLLGLAERAWSAQPEWALLNNKEERLSALNRDWEIFANQLGQNELPRMNTLFGGVNYRISSGEIDGDLKYEFPGYKK